MIENSSALFAAIAVRRGWAAPHQVIRCLRMQEELRRAGREVTPLGALMVSSGLLTAAQVVSVLREQAALLLDLPRQS